MTPPMTATLTQLVLALLAVLISTLVTAFIKKGLPWIDTHLKVVAAQTQNVQMQTYVLLADQAVKWAEVTLPKDADALKKSTVLQFLTDHGVPGALATTLLEAAYHGLVQAA